MSTYTDCLRTVVGISKNDCICYNAGDLPEYKLSQSGLYLDDYLFGIPLSYPAAIHDCDHSDLWLLLVEAREQGIRRFISEFGRAVATDGRYRKIYRDFKGNIGGSKKIGTEIALTYQVMELTPSFSGPVMKINNVTVRGDELLPGAASVLLLDQAMMDADDLSAPLATFTGTFTGTTAVCVTSDGLPVQVDLRLSDRFYLVWVNNSERIPHKIASERSVPGCCGKAATIAGWTTYTAASTYGLTNLSDWFTATKSEIYTQGVQVNVSFACDAFFLCDTVNFEDDAFGRVVAELIVLYSNQQLIGYILSSDKVNIYTSARSEELIEKQKFIGEQIPDRLMWVAENLPVGANTCYICNPRQRRRSLLV